MYSRTLTIFMVLFQAQQYQTVCPLFSTSIWSKKETTETTRAGFKRCCQSSNRVEAMPKET